MFGRMLVAVAYPWLTITMWFTAEALGFRLPAAPWEIIYANVVTVVGIYLAVRLDELFDQVEFRTSLKVLVALTFALRAPRVRVLLAADPDAVLHDAGGILAGPRASEDG